MGTDTGEIDLETGPEPRPEPVPARVIGGRSETYTSLVPPRSGRGRVRLRPESGAGFGDLRRAVRMLGGRVLDGRTTLGRELATWKHELVRDLGGPERVSTQQAALVDLAVRSKLLIDSIDAYVLAMGSPVNRRTRALHPVVKERQALVAQLQSLLRDLGLERRGRAVPHLATYLAERATGSTPKVASEPPPECPMSGRSDATAAGNDDVGEEPTIR